MPKSPNARQADLPPSYEEALAELERLVAELESGQLPLDRLLQAFVKQHRMKLPGGAAYKPCYRVVGAN